LQTSNSPTQPILEFKTTQSHPAKQNNRKRPLATTKDTKANPQPTPPNQQAPLKASKAQRTPSPQSQSFGTAIKTFVGIFNK
jgi:hypothetical protein